MTPGRDPEVQALLDRDAIREVMYRYARGLDRADVSVMRSAFHPEATAMYGSFDGPAYEYLDMIGASGRRIKVTGSHHITNMRIEIEGDTARAETYMLAFHPYFASESVVRMAINSPRYLDRLERRDGQWRISRREVVTDWSRDRLDGDAWLVTTSAEGGFLEATKDEDDPSYAFFGD